METNQQTLPHGYVLLGEKNRYVIDRVLGQGAFGITYLARYRTTIQGSMGTGSGWMQVAVKEFFMRDLNTRDESTGFLNDASQNSLIGRYRRAFMREARNLAGLHHANIVNVFEVIETNNTVYIVMEYINGGSLDEHIAQAGHLLQDESIDKMLQLCSAVECMHENRMLHLDIKPKNVMLDEDGNLYLIDFGLSKQFNADGEPESSTTIGLGTPGYAPGEQVLHQDGEKKFPATLDIYALGATLYKMLTGHTPPNATEVSDSVLDGENIIPKRLKDAGVTGSLAAVVAKAMFPSSSKRYQTVQELERALMDIKESTSDGLPVPDPAPLVPAPNPIPPVHVPNPVSDSGKDKGPVNSNPNPGPEPKPGFPKWLYYAIGAALLVLLIVFLSILMSRPTPEPTNPVPTDSIVVPVPEPEPVSSPTPKPEEPKTVALTSISLNKTSLTLEEGATSTLTVKYTPSNATDKTTTWKSTDTKVATVNSNGKVTAVKAGVAAIIATCGGKEAYCNVSVTAKPQPVQQQQSSSSTATVSTPPATTVTTPPATTSSTDTDTGKENGHEWVDLGLSVKWATCNVGASSPEGYGDYYAWGETSTKSSYTWENYRFRTSGASDNVKLSKYNTKSNRGKVDNKSTIDMSDDVARQKWGGSWRMPNIGELIELRNHCTWTWTTRNDVKGYLVTRKRLGHEDASIFLPAAGYRNGTNLYGVGSYGLYWSSSLATDDPSDARLRRFDSDGLSTGYLARGYGLSVRPVCP